MLCTALTGCPRTEEANRAPLCDTRTHAPQANALHTAFTTGLRAPGEHPRTPENTHESHHDVPDDCRPFDPFVASSRAAAGPGWGILRHCGARIRVAEDGEYLGTLRDPAGREAAGRRRTGIVLDHSDPRQRHRGH